MFFSHSVKGHLRSQEFREQGKIRTNLLVLEPLPKLILGAIIPSNIILARVDHERQVALGVEASRVVVHRGGKVDRAALQAEKLLQREKISTRGQVYFTIAPPSPPVLGLYRSDKCETSQEIPKSSS